MIRMSQNSSITQSQDDRISKLELEVQNINDGIKRLLEYQHDQSANVTAEVQHERAGARGISRGLSSFNEEDSDPQGDFNTLKDTLQKIKLPSDLKLTDSKTGIKGCDTQHANFVQRSAKYAETGMRLISKWSAPDYNITEADLEDLFTVQFAHMRYCQEEYQALLIKGSYDEGMAKLFRTVRKNTTAFSPDTVESVRTTAILRQAQIQSQQADRRGGRGYYFHSPRGRFRGYHGQDRYHQMQRSFQARGGFSGPNRGRGAGSAGDSANENVY